MEAYDTIFLVDDFEMVNLLHGILFKKIGMNENVQAFTDPMEALNEILSKVDDAKSVLILLDINMPEMSGFEFLDILQKKLSHGHIDVVIVTSSISDEDKAKVKKYPLFVKDYVVKPLKLDRLKELVQEPKEPDTLIS